MNPDREQAYELVARQPEISLDAATVREIIEKYNCDDSPHFLATVHLAERVIQLERGLRELCEAVEDEVNATGGGKQGFLMCRLADARDLVPIAAFPPKGSK